MNHICNYVLIRFRPYVETEEFVNIGIAMFDAVKGQFIYRITINDGRAKQFFADIDPNVYDRSIEDLHKELNRLKTQIEGLVAEHHENTARNIFYDLSYPRESIIQYSKIRAEMTNDAHDSLHRLCRFYLK